MSRPACSSAARTRGACDPLRPVTSTWRTATRLESRSHSHAPPSSTRTPAQAATARTGGRRGSGGIGRGIRGRIRRRGADPYPGAPMQLRDLTTLRLGGPAGRYLEAGDEAAVVEAVRAADAAGEPLLVLAGGSNVVVADEGFPGTVLRIVTRGIAREGATLDVAAGEPWDPLVATCVDSGLAGVECLAGIPGSVGATPIQNVGAYGQEVAETVASVRVFDRVRDAVDELDPAACAFTYRSSAFKRDPGRWVVLAVRYVLQPSIESAPIRYAELARALGVGLGDRAPLAEVRSA